MQILYLYLSIIYLFYQIHQPHRRIQQIWTWNLPPSTISKWLVPTRHLSVLALQFLKPETRLKWFSVRQCAHASCGVWLLLLAEFAVYDESCCFRTFDDGRKVKRCSWVIITLKKMACDILRDYWLVSSLFVLATSAAILGDECDWTGRWVFSLCLLAVKLSRCSCQMICFIMYAQ